MLSPVSLGVALLKPSQNHIIIVRLVHPVKTFGRAEMPFCSAPGRTIISFGFHSEESTTGSMTAAQRRDISEEASRQPVQDNIGGPDADLLRRVEQALPILADLSRSDLLLYAPVGAGRVEIKYQARPRSIFPLYANDLVGNTAEADSAPWVFRALSSSRPPRAVQSALVGDVPIMRQVLPVRGASGEAIAAVSIETNLLAHERHKRRSNAFQRALQLLLEMGLRGELAGADKLSPFGEHDGIVVIDEQRRIRYMSGIATNLYRHIGYMSSLLGQSVYSLGTADAELTDAVLKSGTCLEREHEEHGRVWVRKVIPLYVRRPRWTWLFTRPPNLPCPPGAVPAGVLWTVHDATEAREKESELEAKNAMVQEIHHRVKNNLQVIASLLRMQSRRASQPEVVQALGESVNRIMSVAVVHEFLSCNNATVIDVREVAQHIIDQMTQSLVDPRKTIRFTLQGTSVYLSSQQATACALVVNELLQNAVEHGYRDRESGLVAVQLADDGEWVTIVVADDGAGLPQDFDVKDDGGLGLRIVRSLVQGDLKGRFEIKEEQGVKAIVAFPKTPLGGSKS